MLNNRIGKICRAEEGITVVMVTYENRIGFRDDGKLLECASAGELSRNSEHPRLNQFRRAWNNRCGTAGKGLTCESYHRLTH